MQPNSGERRESEKAIYISGSLACCTGWLRAVSQKTGQGATTAVFFLPSEFQSENMDHRERFLSFFIQLGADEFVLAEASLFRFVAMIRRVIHNLLL